MQADTIAREEMVRLGIPRPPGVAFGDRVVHGWNPEGYAALLGVDYRAAKRFTPAELASRLDRVLEAAQNLTERFDARQMDHVPPERKRHAHHWLILHGRYVCKARRPECPRCLIRDICRFKEKTPGAPVHQPRSS